VRELFDAARAGPAAMPTRRSEDTHARLDGTLPGARSTPLRWEVPRLSWSAIAASLDKGGQ